MMENTQLPQRPKADDVVKALYKTIGMHLSIFRELCGMKVDEFNEQLAQQLNYSKETVRGYAFKGISSEVDKFKLLSALTKIAESTIDKQKRSEKQAIILFPSFFFISLDYEMIGFFSRVPTILPEEIQMRMAILSFINNLNPETFKMFSEKEADYLRKSLMHCCPQCTDDKEIKAAIKKVTDELGEMPKSKQRLMEILRERALKNLVETVYNII